MAHGLRIDDLAFQCDGLAADASLRLIAVEGQDRISQLYRYELLLETSQDGGLDEATLVDLMQRRVSFWMSSGGRADTIHGVVESIELQPPHRGSPIRYRLILVPELFRAGLCRRSRMFHSMSYPAIVREVLNEQGITDGNGVEFRLTRGTHSAYPELVDPSPASDDFVDFAPREYTVQYEESDLHFIQRLLEHEGIHYHFVQGDDREILVIGSDNSAFPAAETLDYQSDVTVANDASVVTSIRQRLAVRPAQTEVRDYNWRTPSIKVEGQAQVDEKGFGVVADYGDHFKTASEGARYAALRAQEIAARRLVFAGTTNHTGLRPGARITLAGCPVPDLDQDYLLTEVRQRVPSPDEGGARPFEMEFLAIPFEVEFVPERLTPRPRIDGVMHAHIDGEVAGMVAPIDGDGRYRVRLPFDSGEYIRGRSSRWIRMAQPTSGEGYGMHFPLHVGVEVLLSHVDGNPDRPVIVGSIPNRETVTPVTQDNATQSQVRTKSGILMEFEDDA